MPNSLSSGIKEFLVNSEKIKSFRSCCWRTTLDCLLNFRDKKNLDGDLLEISTDEEFLFIFFEKTLQKNGIRYEVFQIEKTKSKKSIRFKLESAKNNQKQNFLPPKEIKTAEINLNKDDYSEVNFPEPSKKCCRLSFFITAFIGNGYLSNPQKNYHLEFDSHSLNGIKALQRSLASENIEGKFYEKNKNFFVLYLKKSEEIIHFLGLIGANKTLLEIENVRIEKDIKNKLIRQINYETSNLQKTIESSVKYTQAIEWYIHQGCFSLLPDNLQETAKLRLRYPENNLRELCELSEEKITKSCLNHRLRKLYQIIEKAKNDILN